jgi:hypothetical protein
MGKHRTPYPAEFRAQMVELGEGRAQAGGTGKGVRADRADDLQLGGTGRSRCGRAP